MSRIDLDRLIVRQTYFIPVKSTRLESTIEKELNASSPPICKVTQWGVAEKHGLNFHFISDMKYSFLFDETWGINLKTKEGRKLSEEKSEEFDRGGIEAFHTKLKKIRPDLPARVYVSVINEEENGCLCTVECFPMLYEKLRCLKGKETEELAIQVAYLESKRFLEMVFESGLSATLVTEEKKLPPQALTQLLINDQGSRQILKKIEPMLDQATNEVLICGWIGTLLLPKLREIKEKGVNIRAITHKATELKGQQGRQDVQRAHRELISMIGKDHISIRPECHCRVVVVDNKALIGSMDLNAISLTGSHRELAIYTEDPEIVRSLRNYFNGIFSPLSKENAK